MPTDVVTLPAVAESVPDARRFIRRCLIEFDAEGAVDDAETLVSELATNAVLHAKTDFTIAVSRTNGTIHVRVHDLSAVLPRERHYGPDATTGRGIRLIAALALLWGVEPEGQGKAVWFELDAGGSSALTPGWDDATVDVDALLDSYDDGKQDPQAGVRAMAA